MRILFIIAKNNFLLELRNGRLVVSTLAVWLILILSKIFLTWLNLSKSMDITAVQAGEKAFEMSWTGFLYLALILLSMTSILTIPYERNHNLLEINYTLPVKASQYFAGKILGAWMVVALLSFLSVLIYIITNFLIFNTVEISLIFDLFFFAVLPLLLWTSCVGLLAGSFIDSQKTATIIGLLIGLFSVPIWTLLFRDIPAPFMGQAFSSSDLFVRQQSADFIFSKHNLLAAYFSDVSFAQFFSAAMVQLCILVILFYVVAYWAKLKGGIS